MFDKTKKEAVEICTKTAYSQVVGYCKNHPVLIFAGGFLLGVIAGRVRVVPQVIIVK